MAKNRDDPCWEGLDEQAALEAQWRARPDEWAEAAQLLQDAEAAQARPEFQIENDRQAVWLCRVVEAWEAEVAHRRRTLQAAMAEYQAWRQAAEQRLQRQIAWANGLAEGYVRRHPERLLGQKSLSLPGGRRLGWRWQTATYHVVNETAHARWCQAHGLVMAVPLPLKALSLRVDEEGTVQAEFLDQQTGEITWEPVPGVAVSRPAGDTFHIQLAKRPPTVPEDEMEEEK
jgi:hypothetical protein